MPRRASLRAMALAAVGFQGLAFLTWVKGGQELIRRPWKENCPAACARIETLRATRYYGRAFWRRWTGYHARSRIEAIPLVTSRRDALPGRGCDASRLSVNASPQETQTAEIHICIAFMNRFNALGTAEIVRIA